MNNEEAIPPDQEYEIYVYKLTKQKFSSRPLVVYVNGVPVMADHAQLVYVNPEAPWDDGWTIKEAKAYFELTLRFDPEMTFVQMSDREDLDRMRNGQQ